jgi:SAM-dependent methyltransferase
LFGKGHDGRSSTASRAPARSREAARGALALGNGITHNPGLARAPRCFPLTGVDLPVLGSHFKDLVGRYHGPEGDQFALDELAPVASRFTSSDSRVLEVGCGYGRNLMALASLKPRLVVGSDVDEGELKRAADKRATLPATQFSRIDLVRQEPKRLPFRDGSFRHGRAVAGARTSVRSGNSSRRWSTSACAS